MEALPKPPRKIKMNEKWLQNQIDKSAIRKEDYNKNGANYIAGIRVEITDEVETYEVVYDD